MTLIIYSLTGILIALKVTNVILWSWGIVFLPFILHCIFIYKITLRKDKSDW